MPSDKAVWRRMDLGAGIIKIGMLIAGVDSFRVEMVRVVGPTTYTKEFSLGSEKPQ